MGVGDNMNKLQQWAAGVLGLAVKADIPLSRVRWSAYGTHANSDANKFSDTPDGWINAAHANVWARNCIRARASAIAQTPMKLYQYNETSGEEEEITQHEALDLLETVNPINSNKTSFRRAIETQLSIHGDCIIKKVRGINNKVRELYLLPRQLCLPEPDDNRFISGYRWMVTGELIPPEEVIRFWYPSPDGSIEAESPTSTALRYINPYGVADVSAEAIDRRGGQGGGIVSYDALSNNIDIERMKSEWERKYSDPRNAGVDKHMPPGTKYESGALTAQQMQREERMMRLAHNIMACYFVPPANAGDMSDASVLANAAMQSKTFWELFALDELGFIAEVFNNELLWREWPGSYEDGLYFKHDVSEVSALSEDADSKMNRAVVGVQGGVISINEGRNIIGMEPVENDPQADQVTFTVEQKQSPPPQGEQTQPETPSVKAFPIIDFVGMNAITPDGEGIVESIKRFGEYDGLEATKAAPVVIVSGKAYPAGSVKVLIDG